MCFYCVVHLHKFSSWIGTVLPLVAQVSCLWPSYQWPASRSTQPVPNRATLYNHQPCLFVQFRSVFTVDALLFIPYDHNFGTGWWYNLIVSSDFVQYCIPLNRTPYLIAYFSPQVWNTNAATTKTIQRRALLHKTTTKHETTVQQNYYYYIISIGGK